MPEFRRRTTLDASPDEVYAWHERPGVFERLTPPWEHVRVTRPGDARTGSRVAIQVKRGPVEFAWEFARRDIEPGRQFVDEQVKGPFRRWIHTHRFLPAEGGGCVLEDVVEWDPPLGAAGDALTGPLVDRDLERAIGFAHRRLAHDLALHARHASRPRLTVAVTGASGLIGSALTHLLTTGGHRVIPMVRRQEEAGADAIYWNVARQEIDAQRLVGVDAVVHLAGEPISAVRWTAAKKQAIRESRVRGTELLARTLAELDDGPAALLMASGLDYFGDRGEEIVTERSGPGRGFLAETCAQWESAARRAEGAGLRVVKVRNALVVSGAGGAIPLMSRAFKAGLGGRVGSGRQYLSWIDLDDVTGVFYHALMDTSIRGVLLGAAPHPVPNATFADVLGRVLHRPTLLPVPAFAVRAGLGEMGVELLLHGQRARPEATLATGYRFRYENLEDSLRHQLGRDD